MFIRPGIRYVFRGFIILIPLEYRLIMKGDNLMGNMYRDVNLGEVNESFIGKEVKVAGWVENIRDHGGVSFIDLRDMYGVLQVVLRPYVWEH